MGKKNKKNNNQNCWEDEPSELVQNQSQEASFSPGNGKKGKKGKKGKNITHNGFSTGAFGVLGGGGEDDSMCHLDHNISDAKVEADMNNNQVFGEPEQQDNGVELHRNDCDLQNEYHQNEFEERQQNGFGGSQQGGFGSAQQGGFGGSQKSGFGGSQQGGFGSAQQGGFGGSQKSGFGGSQQGGFAGSQQGGFAGSQQGGFQGSQQGGFGGSQQGGFQGSQQGGFGGSQQGGFGGSQKSGFGGSQKSGFGGSQKSGFGELNHDGFGSSQKVGFGESNQGAFGGSQLGGFGGSQQGSQLGGFGGSQQGGFGDSQHGGFGGSQRGGFGGSQQSGFESSKKGEFGGSQSQQGAFGEPGSQHSGSQQNGFQGSFLSSQHGSQSHGLPGSHQNVCCGSQKSVLDEAQISTFGSRQDVFMDSQSNDLGGYQQHGSEQWETNGSNPNSFRGSKQSGFSVSQSNELRGSQHIEFDEPLNNELHGSRHSALGGSQRGGFRGSQHNSFGGSQRSGFAGSQQNMNGHSASGSRNNIGSYQDPEEIYDDFAGDTIGGSQYSLHKDEVSSQRSHRTSNNHSLASLKIDDNADQFTHQTSHVSISSNRSRESSRSRVFSQTNLDEKFLQPVENASRKSSVSSRNAKDNEERYGSFVNPRRTSTSSYQDNMNSINQSVENTYEHNVHQFNQLLGVERNHQNRYGSCQFDADFDQQSSRNLYSKSTHTLQGHDFYDKSNQPLIKSTQNGSHVSYSGNVRFPSDGDDGEGMDDFSENQVQLRSMVNDEKCTNHRLSKLSINTNADEFVLVGGQPPPGVVDGRASCPAGRSRRSRKMMRSTDFLTDQDELLGGSIRSTSAMSRQSLRSTNEHELRNIGIEEEDGGKMSPDFQTPNSTSAIPSRAVSNQSVDNYVKSSSSLHKEEISIPFNCEEEKESNKVLESKMREHNQWGSRKSVASTSHISYTEDKLYRSQNNSQSSLRSGAGFMSREPSRNSLKDGYFEQSNSNRSRSVSQSSAAQEIQIPFNGDIESHKKSHTNLVIENEDNFRMSNNNFNSDGSVRRSRASSRVSLNDFSQRIRRNSEIFSNTNLVPGSERGVSNYSLGQSENNQHVSQEELSQQSVQASNNEIFIPFNNTRENSVESLSRNKIGSNLSIKSKNYNSEDQFVTSRAPSNLSIRSSNVVSTEDQFIPSRASSRASINDNARTSKNDVAAATVNEFERVRTNSTASQIANDEIFIPSENHPRSRTVSVSNPKEEPSHGVVPLPRSRANSQASFKSGYTNRNYEPYENKNEFSCSRPTSQYSLKSGGCSSQQSRAQSHISLNENNHRNDKTNDYMQHSQQNLAPEQHPDSSRTPSGVLKKGGSTISMDKQRSGILSKASSRCSVSFSQGLHKEYVDENGNVINRSRTSSFAGSNRENGDDTEENLLIADYNSKLESHWDLGPSSQCDSSIASKEKSHYQNIPDIVVVPPEETAMNSSKQNRTPPALRKARMRSKSSVDIGKNFSDEVPQPIIFTDALTPQSVAPRSRIQKNKPDTKNCEIAIQTGETIRLRQMTDFSNFESSTNFQPSKHEETSNNTVFNRQNNQHPAAAVINNFFQQQGSLNQSGNRSHHQVTMIHNDKDSSLNRSAHTSEAYTNYFNQTRVEDIPKKPWEVAGAVEIVPKEIAAEMRDQVRPNVLAEAKQPLTPTGSRIQRSKFDEFEKYSREDNSYDSSRNEKRNYTSQSNGSNNSGLYRWSVNDPKSESKVPDVKWSDNPKRAPGCTVRESVKAGKIRDLASMFNHMQAKAREEEAMLRLKSSFSNSQDENNNDHPYAYEHHNQNNLDMHHQYNPNEYQSDERKSYLNERKYYPVEPTTEKHRKSWFHSNDIDGALLDVNEESEHGSVIDRYRTSTPLNDYIDHENMTSQFCRIPSIRSDEPPVTVSRHPSNLQRNPSKTGDKQFSSGRYPVHQHENNQSNQYSVIEKHPKTSGDYAEICYSSGSPRSKRSTIDRSKLSSGDNNGYSAIKDKSYHTEHSLQRRSSRGGEYASLSSSQKSKFGSIVEETVNEQIDSLFGFVDEQSKQPRQPPQSKQGLHYSISTYRALQKFNKAHDDAPIRFSPSVAPHASELSECSISCLTKKNSNVSNYGLVSAHRFGGRPADLVASTPKSSPTHRVPINLEESYVSSISEGSRHEEKMNEYKKQFNKLVHQLEMCQEQIDMTQKALLKARKEKKQLLEVTAQRSILIASQRALLLKRELQNIQAILQLKKQPPLLNHDLRGSMSISNITLHLNRAISHRVTDNSSFVFVVLLKSGCELEATVPVTLLINYQSPVKLQFTEKISFHNLPIDFSVDLEVYVMVLPEVKNDENSCATTIANKCRNLLGPGRKAHSSTGLPVGEFVRGGYLRLDRETTSFDKFYLDDAQYPLEGTISVTSSCTSLPHAIELDYRGFLTMYQSIAGGSWERYWAVLRRGSIYFWKYPDEDAMGKPPRAYLKLQSCTKDVIVPCSLDQCARPYTFSIEILVNTTPSMIEKKRIVLAADSREFMCAWIEAINETLSVIREH